MQLVSSSPSPQPSFPFCNLSQKTSPPKSKFNFSTNALHSSPFLFRSSPCSPTDYLSIPLEKLQTASSSSSSWTSPSQCDEEKHANGKQEKPNTRERMDGSTLVVRRPVMNVGGESDDVNGDTSYSPIDAILLKFAKKMPVFEPGRVESKSERKPLPVNLDLALYRAKILTRNYQFEEAERLLRKCIRHWPEDGRSCVALGKVLIRQSRIDEARALYEEGCRTTQGENSYIWQCWAVLENNLGNVKRARELFGAATAADKSHTAAWHGWAVLELKQGNTKKARILLGKGLKYCGGNEYIYQTLAMMEAKANRYEQAKYLFEQAIRCNPRSCASWLAWAQLEMQQENNSVARRLFERAIQASPKNRFAWHVWGIFEASVENIDRGRKLLTVGHLLNPRDPVLLQSLALLEYKHSNANLSRTLFRRASESDPKHQPVWMAWGWLEWKEGNIAMARQLYRRALSIDSTSETAARCLQAWGVLEHKTGNPSSARKLFRSSLRVNPQSYITWMTWASMEEEEGNPVRAEEIRNLYFQQRTEVVDDASWTMEFFDNFVDPALDGIKKLFSFNRSPRMEKHSRTEQLAATSMDGIEGRMMGSGISFDLDDFISKNLSIDPSKLDDLMVANRTTSPRGVWRPKK